MTNNSQQTIQFAVSVNFISAQEIPFINEALDEMKGSSKGLFDEYGQLDINRFCGLIQNKRRVYIVSAPTVDIAIERGLPQEYAPYFESAKKKAGLSSTTNISYKAAGDLYARMENDSTAILCYTIAGVFGGGPLLFMALLLCSGRGTSDKKNHDKDLKPENVPPKPC
jgi:hypothetical protein